MGKRDASHFITEYYTERGKVELMIPTDATDDDFALLKDILALVEAKMKQRADRKTENSSEKPNNCEPQTIRCPKCGRTDYIRDMEKDMGIKGSHYKYKCINCNFYIKTEPTISKMEQVDKEYPRCVINGTPFDECGFCEHFNCDTCKCKEGSE